MASGRSDVLRPRRSPKGRIPDTRIAGLIPGIANHEARLVYDTRVARLREALAQPDEARVESLLCDAHLLGIWRARNLTGFDALAQDVLGIDLERAASLAERGAQARGIALDRLPDVAVALWLRSEAALLATHVQAAIDVRLAPEQAALEIRLRLPLAPKPAAPEALAAIGRSAAGLARVITGDQPERVPHPKPPRE